MALLGVTGILGIALGILLKFLEPSNRTRNHITAASLNQQPSGLSDGT
jgi:hypothetical protein